jgi:hypothetical protein
VILATRSKASSTSRSLSWAKRSALVSFLKSFHCLVIALL